MTTQTEKILQGCGKNSCKYPDCFYYCGSLHLCPTCKAQAQTLLETYKDKINDNNCEQEFLVYLTSAIDKEDVLKLVRERLKNIKKEYSSLKSNIKKLEEVR